METRVLPAFARQVRRPRQREKRGELPGNGPVKPFVKGCRPQQLYLFSRPVPTDTDL
ncbi:MAG TPA: hypothetical protein VHD63_02765 [Ktedonobacteraceae bacterium]|nr:hypothetical protein [Ktedonobacteraceae bacterium]